MISIKNCTCRKYKQTLNSLEKKLKVNYQQLPNKCKFLADGQVRFSTRDQLES